jgi:tripartite-type tricarboxylate transporter receptor subunit TctC
MKRLLAAAATLPCVAPAARAQDFPTRQGSMIVVFAPGGTTDVLTRTRRSVVMENVFDADGSEP